jgi:hypothetical protein
MNKRFKKSRHSSKIKSFWYRPLCKENNAQLLLLGGIIISVILIASAAIAINLSNISIPLDKTSSIKTDYDNIRKEFGIALKDNVKDYLTEFDPDDALQLTQMYSEDIKDTFVFFIESYNDNYFDAEIGEEWKDGIVGVITVKLTLSDSDEIIQEEVVYDLR